MKGKLFLIPVPISDDTQSFVIPLQVRTAISQTHHFLCENIRTARRYVSSLKIHEKIESLSFEVLDKNTNKKDLPGLLQPLLDGMNVGILSESGCPGVADPGALGVKYAHEQKIQVVPLVGPSSILLALMASGLNGQKFAFHGYLPVDSGEASHAIKSLEQVSGKNNQTQIFIETPYRNNSLFTHLIKTLQSDTQLCVAYSLTSPEEMIVCKEVGLWRKDSIKFDKEPAIFLFLAS